MRREDIKKGVVYAYDEGSMSGYTQIVFLTEVAKDTLQTYARHRKEGEPVFKAVPTQDKPGRHGANTYGWLVARGRDVSKASLEEATTMTDAALTGGRPYSYTLMTNMARVTGPSYAEVTAEKEKAERERAEARAAVRAREDAEKARMEALHERLTALGVQATLARSSWSHLHNFQLTEAQANHLAELLDDPDGDWARRKRTLWQAR